MKILVILFGGTGNLVQATPVFRCLKRAGHTVHLLAVRAYRDALGTNPNIDAYFDYDVSPVLNEKLLAEAYDHIIDLQNNTTSHYLMKVLETRSLRAPRHRWTDHLMEFRHRPGPPREHTVDRYFEALRPLGIGNDGAGLDYFIPASEEVPYSDIPTSHQLGFLALVISGAPTNRLPMEQLAIFCTQLGHPIIVLGDPADAANGDTLQHLDPGKIYNACGKFSFHEQADLLRKAKLVVTHDHDLMQVAAALKRPVIAVWGSTVPAQGNGPYYGEAHQRRNPVDSVDIQVEKMWCRPCTDTGRDRCPLGHFKCMKKIDIGNLVKAAEARLWKPAGEKER
ncbi:glycosyl transferase [Flaviaesturariibacter flavus]|uniref:Glycosyl transferase n=1 Tax=Flaviaesturariibacter flavus TaxID=2502780 RepID=A0A4R1BKC6_9BACT|nr:glycosyltransferase family 9 protein [Flaviaesturariibacter flavus]TCJ17668.1 glycosyl transferase [Flaviaesturariibacter flavus]